MLYEYLKDVFLYTEDWNCAEHMLVAANKVYGLGLDKQAIKLSAGFGGGLATGDICGALTGAVMVLGALFVEERAHESERIKVLTKELISRYQESMGHIDCEPLKQAYRNDDIKCREVILPAAAILDDIVKRECKHAPFVAK